MDPNRLLSSAVEELTAHPEVGRMRDFVLDTAQFTYEQTVRGKQLRISLQPKANIGTWHYIRVQIRLSGQTFDYHLDREGCVAIPIRDRRMRFRIRYDTSVRTHAPRFGSLPGEGARKLA